MWFTCELSGKNSHDYRRPIVFLELHRERNREHHKEVSI